VPRVSSGDLTGDQHAPEGPAASSAAPPPSVPDATGDAPPEPPTSLDIPDVAAQVPPVVSAQVTAAPVTAAPVTAAPVTSVPAVSMPVVGMPGQVQYAPPPVGYPPLGYPPPPYPPPPYPPASALEPMSAPQVLAPYAYPGQVVYGAPYPAYWPYPVPPPRPATSRATRVTVLALLIALAVSVVGVGGLTAYAAGVGAFGSTPIWQDTAPKEPPPAENAPASAWADWARRSVDDAIRAQAQALVTGDQNVFTGVADPANATLVTDLKRRFSVLRAMGLGVWTEALTGGLKENGARSWSGDIKVNYCFGDKNCVTAQIVEPSRWELRNDQLVMVELGKSDPDQNGPRPWEADQLVVKRGTRAVVAATKANEWRLDSAVAAADKAAAVADAFAKWSPAPNRYVIFLASPAEWSKWYGHEQPEWAAAWAVPVGDTVTEVVVRTEVVQQRGLENLLTHELTHVTSLAGKRLGAARSWWLIEGIAEYATMTGQQLSAYDGLDQTHDFVRSTKWDGKPNVAPPSTRASLDEAAARYGVAFLAVRRIAEKYGQDKMLTFWGQAVHDDKSLEDASQSALGTSWATVSADCASYIRRSVG
jgi:hypothetical protein